MIRHSQTSEATQQERTRYLRMVLAKYDLRANPDKASTPRRFAFEEVWPRPREGGIADWRNIR